MSCDIAISLFFFFNDTATTEIYTLSLHDALPICRRCSGNGHLPGFRHVDGGRCFRCHAAGIDPKPTTEYAPSVRAKLDERAARRRNAKEARLLAAFDGWLAQRPELAAALERADADIRAW